MDELVYDGSFVPFALRRRVQNAARSGDSIALDIANRRILAVSGTRHTPLYTDPLPHRLLRVHRGVESLYLEARGL